MKKSYLPWLVLALLFVATGLSFLDRQVLSMTIIKIQAEFKFSDVEYGFVNTAFLISYALMFTVGGRLIDTWGSKIGLAVAVGVWSVACGLHGVMTSFYQLVAFRFLLGMGEGACFPGAAKTVYEWFDEKKRGLANGIAIGGAAIGAVIAPPLIILISSHFGWRWSFIIPGIAGIVWVIIWLYIPWGENSHTNKNQSIVKQSVIPFITILKNRAACIFILIRFLLDPVMYFIMFWVPKYLHAERNVSFEQIGNLFWIPFLALGISNIIGGWFSDKLVKNNFSINRARKTVMGIAALLTIVAPFIAWVSTVEMALALMAVIMFAHGFWITNYITAISDIFGKNGTSTVVGLSGTAGAISGLIINPLIGLIVQNYSYTPIWIASGILYPLAFILFMVFIRRIQPFNFETKQVSN
ncbi:MAG: MFS transporter [Daejeonella sp.]|uniref:MFS transporter n=1 Tax=Daejeonella sp. TaxID=2805397 RepID=UPI002736B461|nr:MFS transporter [Daejeonella sp.]MDP3467957.1 MFS transporter [Daejeonella sp.]